MKKSILAIMVLVTAFCSCEKEEPQNDENKTPLTFTAIMEGTPDSRVTLDGRIPSWEVGDSMRILVKGIYYPNPLSSYLYKAQSAGHSSKFTPVEESAPERDVYRALYPSSYLVTWGTDTQMFFPPDEEYPWKQGEFRMPMYAKSEDTTFRFKNLCGVLAIKVNDHQMQQVKRIRVYNTSKPMFGIFDVNSDGAMILTNPSPSPAEGERMRSIIFSEPVPVYEESKVFYIPLVPQAYGYLRIDISEDGQTFPYQLGTNSRANVVIERNKIYNINFTDPRSTEYITVIPEELNNDDFE